MIFKSWPKKHQGFPNISIILETVENNYFKLVYDL